MVRWAVVWAWFQRGLRLGAERKRCPCPSTSGAGTTQIYRLTRRSWPALRMHRGQDGPRGPLTRAWPNWCPHRTYGTGHEHTHARTPILNNKQPPLICSDAALAVREMTGWVSHTCAKPPPSSLLSRGASFADLLATSPASSINPSLDWLGPFLRPPLFYNPIGSPAFSPVVCHGRRLITGLSCFGRAIAGVRCGAASLGCDRECGMCRRS